MFDDALSPDALRALLVSLLAGATESSEAQWRKTLGPVEWVNLTLHPASNWRIEPSGSRADRAAIIKAIEVVRHAHPYVKW